MRRRATRLAGWLGRVCFPCLDPVAGELLGDDGHELLAVGVVEVPHARHLLRLLPVHLAVVRRLELLEVERLQCVGTGKKI